tara:strand:- start:11813 stop:12166 length:354 start_codon:yes stop_codon:yes gene_type:complete
VNHATPSPPPNTSPLIELDLDVYAPYLQDADICEDDKRQLIEALWSIIVSFVQLGYGLTPAQQVLDSRDDAKTACGQLPDSDDHSPIRAPDQVEYSHSITHNFVTSALADDEEGVSL